MNTYTFKVDYPELEKEYNFKSKAIKPEDVNFVVSHGHCSDGFMSRVIVEKAMRDNPTQFKNNLDDVVFYDAYHGNDFTELIKLMKDKIVLICDFSFKEDIFNQMLEVTNGNILILDHHITAKSSLENIADKYKVFDMSHSGAFITQLYINGFMNVPKSVLYVEDNDIWTKKLPYTLEFTAYMFLQPFEYNEYIKLFDDDYVMKQAIPLGVGAVKQNEHHINSILSKTKVSFTETKGRYNMIANINCANILKSELGNHAMNRFSYANFAACYCQDAKYNSTSFSLRSLDDRSDCSYLAQKFGGGGHRNASGMKFDSLVTHFPGKIIDEYRVYHLLKNVYWYQSNNKNILLLNTPMMKTSLCKYLMQERYVGNTDSLKNKSRYDQGLPGYQEGMFIVQNNENNATSEENKNNVDNDNDNVYHCASTWHYDGSTDRYLITVCPLKEMIEDVTKFLDIRVKEYTEKLDFENTESPLNDNINYFSYTYDKRNKVFYVSLNAEISKWDNNYHNKESIWYPEDFFTDMMDNIYK
jgi:oligoribonuclease NrnB/cAMP/cGMP phosphodiesterase (DHH superfamily)